MSKVCFYISILFFMLSSCEEIYHVKLDSVDNIMVVKALVTNDEGENYVLISKTTSFNEVGGEEMVVGAQVELIGEDGQVYKGIESSTGNFKINYAAVSGKNYKLKILAEGEVYESDFELMPPVPSFDSIYVVPATFSSYKYTSNGNPIVTSLTGMQAYVDLPITDSLSMYRFSIDKTMEYRIYSSNWFDLPLFCWQTSHVKGVFAIAAPSDFGYEEYMKRPLTSAGNRIEYMLSEIAGAHGKTYSLTGWIVSMKQFGISESTYDYYEAMNKQLQADGKLFDPVYAQIEPNIKCVSNPKKEIIGLFELSSYRLQRFFMKTSIGAEVSQYYLIDTILPIPEYGRVEIRPDFWAE